MNTGENPSADNGMKPPRSSREEQELYRQAIVDALIQCGVLQKGKENVIPLGQAIAQAVRIRAHVQQVCGMDGHDPMPEQEMITGLAAVSTLAHQQRPELDKARMAEIVMQTLVRERIRE